MTIDQVINVLHQGPKVCVDLLPSSAHAGLYAALICGIRLNEGEAKQLFIDTGLIHIMVVSGAHLLFIERRFAWIAPNARLCVLGTYCWLTGFGAPVVKAFFRRCLERKFGPRGWSPIQCEAAAVAGLLILIPAWLFSRSFLMSWMCSLAFMLPKILPVLDRPLKAYVLLFAFSAASPLTVIWNALLAPFVGEFLFPVCLLVIPFPFLTPLVDLMWDGLLLVLRLNPQSETLNWFAPSNQLFWLPLFAHVIFIYGEVRWRRALAFA